MLVDVYGESIIRDAYGAGPTNHSQKCFSQQLATLLSNASFPVNPDGIVGCTNLTTEAALIAWAGANDERLSVGAGWTHFVAGSVGGNGFQNNITTNALSIRASKAFNQVEVRRFAAVSGDGVYTVSVKGGAPSTNKGGDGGGTVRTDLIAISGNAGDTVDIKWVSGTVRVLAIKSRNTALPSIRNQQWRLELVQIDRLGEYVSRLQRPSRNAEAASISRLHGIRR